MTGSRKPAWMLSTAVTASILATPALLVAQTRPTPPSPQPSQPAAAAPVAGESPIQQELRRLYAESGREMPEAPATLQMQPQAVGTTDSAKAGTSPRSISTPRPSAPAKPNPVMAFFKKLVPSNQPSQKNTTAANTPPKPSAPAAVSPKQAATAPRYSPYPSQPPRRLPSMDSVAAVPPSPAPTTPARTSPVPTTAPQTPVIVPVPNPAIAVTPPLSVKAPEESGPALPPSPATNPFSPTAGPVLTANDVPSIVEEQAPPAAAAEEFPDPFTEISESEADGKREEIATSPFQELMPEDSATEEQSPTIEPAVNGPSLTLSESPAIIAAPDAPVLPPLPDAPALPPLPDDLQPSPSVTPELPVTTTAPPHQTTNRITADTTESKMARIRERGGMKGLKGFCPVTLRDQRELLDAQPEFHSSYRGQKFHFASAEAKAKFDADPTRYAPAAYGADVVVLVRDKDVAEGTLDFAAWFKGRLFLFSSEETSNTFLADPAKYGALAGLE